MELPDAADMDAYLERTEGQSSFPRQGPCRDGLSGPGKSLAGAARPTPLGHTTLEPTASSIVDHTEARAREAPP